MYLRVSHKSSAASGLSIEQQYEQCAGYIKQRFGGQHTPIHGSYPEDSATGVFVDRAVSAWSVDFANRPAGYALTELIKPNQHIVMYSIDRGFRNMKDFAVTFSAWEKAGIIPHFVVDGLDGSSAAGRFALYVKAAAAQYYSDIISKRTREALLIRKHNLLSGGESKKGKQQKSEWIPSPMKFLEKLPPPVIHKSGRIWRYERCSSNAQYVSGLGLQRQAERNAAYAEFMASRNPGLVVLPEAVVDEAYSAYSIPFAKRPGGRRIMEEAREGDHVVIYRLDRAWRSPKDAIAVTDQLLERGVHVHAVDEGISTATESGREIMMLMAWVAQTESSMKARRKLEINARLRDAGRPCCTPPRYMKAEKVGNKKRLAWNHAAIRSFALAWAGVNFAGLSMIAARDLVYTLTVAERGESWSLKMPGFADNVWPNIAVKTFSDLRTQMPERSWQAMAEQACRRLEQPLPAAYEKYFRRAKPPYRVDWERFREATGQQSEQAAAS